MDTPSFDMKEAVIDIIVAHARANDGEIVSVIHPGNLLFIPSQWVSASSQGYAVDLTESGLHLAPDKSELIRPTPICIEDHKAYMLALPDDVIIKAGLWVGDDVIITFDSSTGCVHVRQAETGEDDIRQVLHLIMKRYIREKSTSAD